MHFDINGRLRPQDLDLVIRPLAQLIANEGITEMTSISISFLGWRPDGRAQIVNSKGFITSVSIDGESIVEKGSVERLVMSEGISIRTRPEELDGSPLAIFAGRDD